MTDILTNKYEINKPSSLTQIVYYNPTDKTIAAVSPTQLDLINAMYYIVNRSMHSDIRPDVKERILNCQPDDLEFETFTIKMNEVTSMIGKYNKGQYDYIIAKIKELRHVDVYINALNKDKEMTRTTTSIVGPINEILSDNKIIKTTFPRVLIKSYFNTQKYFKKHYLAIQFSLKSKYSKLLYELAKDYEGLQNGKEISFEELHELLNVTTDTMKVPSRFKAHIMKKSVDEINELTDIKIEWDMTKKNKGYYITIKSSKQSDERLSELGLIESAITTNPHYARSSEKLNKMIERGYIIQNKDAWITEDINRNSENYDAMNSIDEFNQNEQNVKNEFLTKMAQMLNAPDPIICIDNYIIKEIFGTKTYSNDAKETYDLILKCHDAFYE